MKAFLIPLAFLWCVLSFTGCGREPLPESYGIYMRDGHSLTKLQSDMPEEKRRDFSPNAAIIIYDHRLVLAGGTDFATLCRRRYVRFNVWRRHATHDGPITDYVIRKAGRFDAFGSNLVCSIIPIKGQSDMVEVKPTLPLSPGLYYLRFGDELLPFGVKIGNTPEAESQYSGALDAYTDVEAQPGPFDWDFWLQETQKGVVGADARYYDASVLDGVANDWKKQFEGSFAKQEFNECAKILRWMSSGYSSAKEYEGRLLEAMDAAAAKKIDSEPAVAAALANRALKVNSEDKKAKEIAEKGERAIKKWNEEQERLRKEWLAAASDTNNVVLSMPYVARRRGIANPMERFGTITLTDTYYLQDWKGGGQWTHLWLGSDIKMELYSNREPLSIFGGQGTDYFGVRLSADGISCHADFTSTQERNKLYESLLSKMADFRIRFDPEHHSTVGNVREAVDGDQIIYTVVLNDHNWSPPVHIPQEYKSWQLTNTGSDIFEIQTADGTIHPSNGGSISTPADSDLRFCGNYTMRRDCQFKVVVTLW